MSTSAEVARVVLAGFVGGVLAPYLTSGKERRAVRADAARTLAAVERARWARDVSASDFLTAVTAFEAAAMIARVPRDAVDQYVWLATVARRVSAADVKEPHYGDDQPGSVPMALSSLARDAAAIVRGHLWSPLIAAVTRRRKLNRLAKQVELTRPQLPRVTPNQWRRAPGTY